MGSLGLSVGIAREVSNKGALLGVVVGWNGTVEVVVFVFGLVRDMDIIQVVAALGVDIGIAFRVESGKDGVGKRRGKGCGRAEGTCEGGASAMCHGGLEGRTRRVGAQEGGSLGRFRVMMGMGEGVVDG